MTFWQKVFASDAGRGRIAVRQQGPSLPILAYERLAQTVARGADGYRAALPFPHAVVDRFIEPETVASVAEEFPDPGDKAAWLDYNGSEAGMVVQQSKYHISDERRMGPVTQRLLYELKSAAFLELLTRLTGIADLIPDALNYGGGLHMSCNGAMLKIHADFSRHPSWHLERRLNLLLYLNEGWHESYGGNLELWDQGMQACRKKIAPLAGRCVIFSTSATSYHGHPDPIACPDGVMRKSIALYYYTAPARFAEGDAHATLWRARPGIAE